ncbi:MAG: DUF6198 family protein [Clostridia bacterium]|nr:DUF6198 family protein [Clostridia bacterium]
MKTDKKNIFHWAAGILLCCLGIALFTKANFGLSMIAAGPYLLHVLLRDAFPWFSQGTAEYVWEALLLLVLALLMRQFKIRWLLSFGTAVITGLIIDLYFSLMGGNGVFATMAERLLAYAGGTVSCAIGVACYFRTNLPLQVYELVVMEQAERTGKSTDKVKWAFDITMLCICVAMAAVVLLLRGFWTGISWGTAVTTFVNAPLIAVAGKIIDRMEKKNGRRE